MPDNSRNAPGAPGLPPAWTSSAKHGVGTSRNTTSRVWFTLSHGILNEVYYPRLDLACIRDLGFIVTDGKGFFSEEKRDTHSAISTLSPGVPAFHLVNTCMRGQYRIQKEILTDPRRQVLLIRSRFVPLKGALTDYRLFVLLAPHLANRGVGNTAWVGDYKGNPMLFAQRSNTALALACSVPWRERSVGYVGSSDGWHMLHDDYHLTETWDRAEDGNVAMVGEVDLSAARGSFVLALGFGETHTEAGHQALGSLQDGYEVARAGYLEGWQDWQDGLLPLDRNESDPRNLYRTSAAVLRTHSAKPSGGMIASLAIPWGFAKGDNDLGGYHLVWPRDQVESAGGLLAIGAREDARRVLGFLQATQEADGRWPQNMWLDGSPYWQGLQLDETALPILLLGLAHREGALEATDYERFWPMIRRAAGFIVCNGPETQQDRWEEDPGFTPFTLATEIASLLVAAAMADQFGEHDLAGYLRETADLWNSKVEDWLYVSGDLREPEAVEAGLEGYYVRVATGPGTDHAAMLRANVPVRNRPAALGEVSAARMVSPDVLALVRFGIRAPDDPRIVNTVKAIDRLLRVETPRGPAWRRYNGDGYGEKEDGSPFDGTGVGRPWPLLTGERAHYELAAGRREEAKRLFHALEAFANDGGLIPEQVWDGPDMPERELFFGRPTGSAMPLVWAHAEYLKLRRSLRDGKVFDMPTLAVQRYQVEKRGTPFQMWRFNHPATTMATGKTLRIEVRSPALVRWSVNGGRAVQETQTRDTGVGMHVADLPTASLLIGNRVEFTFYWPDAGKEEGQSFTVTVE